MRHFEYVHWDKAASRLNEMNKFDYILCVESRLLKCALRRAHDSLN
jgi:hypothetical protein